MIQVGEGFLWTEMIPKKERLESTSRSHFQEAGILDSQNDALEKVYITSLIEVTEVALYTVSEGYLCLNSGV